MLTVRLPLSFLLQKAALWLLSNSLCYLPRFPHSIQHMCHVDASLSFTQTRARTGMHSLTHASILCRETNVEFFGYSVGCVVLYAAQERFHKSTTETLEYVVNQADTTVDKLKTVSDFIASAKLIGVDQVFLPSNVQTDIDQIGIRINSSASVLAEKTVDNSDDIRDLLDSV